MGACCIDYDPPEFCSTTWKYARKEHKCCECRATIQIGECYEYIAGKWEGDFQTFKTCEKCADLRDSLMDVDCPALGDLRECYVNYLDNIGAARYDEEKDEYIYPQNHLRIGM